MARKTLPDDTSLDTPAALDIANLRSTPAEPEAPAKPPGVRVVVICDLEPWIADAPRKPGDLIDDVEPEVAALMQRRGHVRIIP
jgi:hypothetical protein